MRAFCMTLSKNTNNMQVIQTQNHLQEWTEQNEPIGKMLGYPQCCIDQFCSQPPAALKHHGAGRVDKNVKKSGVAPAQKHCQAP